MFTAKSEDESKYQFLLNKDHDEDDDDIEATGSESTRIASLESFGRSFQIRRHLKDHNGDQINNSRFPSIAAWIRWMFVVILQSAIIVILLRERSQETEGRTLAGKDVVVETGDDINGLYKTLSHTYTYLKPETDKYIPNMTSNENRMEVRRNWDLLMPLGSGSVLISDYKDHPLLGDPITDDPIRSGPLYEASWTHALHCLYYSVDSYHQLIINGRTDQDNPYHAAHCFEYLRNSIMCNLDMTLEGSMSTPQDKSRGQPHVCRNREEAIAWIEQRRADDLQDIVGP